MKKGKLITSLLLGSLLPIGMALTISNMKPVTAEATIVDFYRNLALTEESVTPENGVSYTSAKRLSGTYTYTFSAEELSGHTGHNLIIELYVKADTRVASALITADMTTDVSHTFYLSTQWTRLCLPVNAAGLTALTVKTDEPLLITDAFFTDFGTEDLTGKYDKLGQWLLEDFEEVSLGNSALISANASKDLKIKGDYLYAIGSDKLTIINVADVTNPQVSAVLTGIGSSARQICVTDDGNYAIITSRETGAFIVDVTDKQNPRIATIYNSIEFANGIDIVGDIAMICNRQYGVEMVDISDPLNPKHLCTVDAGGEAQSSTYYDGYIYNGLWGGMALTITDAHDIYNTSIVSTTALPGKGDGVKLYKTSDNRVLCFAAVSHKADASSTEGQTAPEWDDWAFGQGNGFAIYDVTDPEHVEMLSVTRLDGRYYYQNNDYWDINIADDGQGHLYAYTVNTRMGVYVFDCSDLTAPKRVLKLTAEELSGTSLGAQSRYVLYPYDDAYAPQDAIGAIAIKDGTMFLAGSDNGIMMYRDPDLFYPETVPTSQTSPDTTGSDDYYAFDGTGLDNFKQFITEGQIYTALSYEDKIFLAAGREGIVILDEDLNRLNTVATVSARGIVKDIQIKNGKLYAAMGEDGLVCYSISGSSLTKDWAFVYGTIRDFALSKTGKFAAVAYASSAGAILNLETKQVIRTDALSSQLYSRNCGAVSDGRYIGYWGGSTKEIWYDCGADESQTTKPTRVALEKATPVMRSSVTDYEGQILTVNASNKLVTYPANTGLSDSNTRATSTVIASLAYENIGRPAWYKNTLILNNPMGRTMAFFDWSDRSNPVRQMHYTPVGNPGAATITEEMVLIPMGYQGLIKFDYSSLDFEPETHEDHCICGENLTEDAALSSHTCMTEKPQWQPLGSADYNTVMTSAGVNEPAYYYLTEDVTIGSQVSLIANQNITLCLNGHTVKYTGTARNFLMNQGGITFTICDCQGGGMITRSNASGTGCGLIQASKGALNLYGGILKGGKATTYAGGIGVSSGVTFNMYGGSIVNCIAVEQQGGGVRNAGTFNMYGGTISGNSAVDGGGSIYQTGTSAKTNIYGGLVTGGTNVTEKSGSNNGGGNIYINGGSFTMTGGTVSEGTATNGAGKGAYGGNLLIGASTTITISGGTFLNGTATTAGNNICAFSSGANITISGGTFRQKNVSGSGYLFYANGGADGKESTTTISGDAHFIETASSSSKYGMQCAQAYANIIINGGLFETTVYVSNGDLTITDGCFTKKVSMGTTNPTTTTMAISGGHYASTFPGAQIVEGYAKFTENETINGKSYTSHVAPGYLLTLESAVTGSGVSGIANLEGGGVKEVGKSITVTAPETAGTYVFDGWYDGTTLLSAEAEYTIADGITAAKTLTALYRAGVATVSYEVVADDATVLLAGETATLSGTCPVGTEIKITYTGEKPFSMWMNASNKLVTRETEYTFTIYTDTKLSAYAETAAADETQIVFMNENGQVLETVRTAVALIELPEVPVRANKTGGSWSKTLEEINTAIADSAITYLEVTAEFETQESTYTKLADVTAPTVVMQEAVILDQADATKKTLSFSVVRNVPEGYELVEQGVLLSTQAMTGDSTAEADLVLGSAKCVKQISNVSSAEGVTYLNVRNITDGATLYVRGYLIFLNASGEPETVYSSVAKGTTASITEDITK